MEAVILIGIQAAGKSTFYKERFFKSHMRINLDMLRTRNRESIFLEACIKGKQPFVVDNTNPTVEDRRRYIDAAKAADFRIIGYYFEPNIKAAMERNKGRTGKEKIPEKAIACTFSKLQQPYFDEGFDELYNVSIGEGNNFIVEAWEQGKQTLE